MSIPPKVFTKWLVDWSNGDREALDQLIPAVYDELHRRARIYMARERRDHLWQTTVLINEVYLRLVQSDRISWTDRNHFFAVCATNMRRVLIDFARHERFIRQVKFEPLEEDSGSTAPLEADFLAVDEALNRLAAVDVRKARVVEMRFFGGMNIKEIADVLKVSEPTIHLDWKMAKSWLHRELSGQDTHEA